MNQVTVLIITVCMFVSIIFIDQRLDKLEDIIHPSTPAEIQAVREELKKP